MQDGLCWVLGREWRLILLVFCWIGMRMTWIHACGLVLTALMMGELWHCEWSFFFFIKDGILFTFLLLIVLLWIYNVVHWCRCSYKPCAVTKKISQAQIIRSWFFELYFLLIFLRMEIKKKISVNEFAVKLRAYWAWIKWVESSHLIDCIKIKSSTVIPCDRLPKLKIKSHSYNLLFEWWTYFRF